MDIDRQAVEVTKLSLLLKLLEGESGELKGMLIKYSDKKLLPDLSGNIKSGNSLIGSDFYQQGQMSLFQDEETVRRINVFDWQEEFPEIFKQGGFDVVIGNPPYIRIQNMKEYAPEEVKFFKEEYKSASKGNYDIYVIFVEKGLRLSNENSVLGFILPSKFFTTDYGLGLRSIIAEKKVLFKIIDFTHAQIFENATTYTNLLFLSRTPSSIVHYAKVTNPPEISHGIIDFQQINKEDFSEMIWTFPNKSEQKLIEKVHQFSTVLMELHTQIGRGSSSGMDKVFIIQEEGNSFVSQDGEKIEVEKDILRIPIFATDFGRYFFNPKSGYFIIFPYIVDEHKYQIIPEDELKQKYPNVFKYLLNHKKELMSRKQYKEWYGFSAPRNLNTHEKANLLVPLLAERGSYCKFSNSTNLCLMASGGFSISIIESKNLSANYVLGLLNSKLLFWRLYNISNKFRGGWITCTKQYVATLPIKNINFLNKDEKSMHDRIVEMVDQMLDLQKKYHSARMETEKNLYKKQIRILDRQIDQTVYQLYQLSDDEIKIIEEDAGEKN